MSNQVKSGIGTAVFGAIIVVILLAFGYNPPDPPIPEEGVEVNVGDSDFGLGSSAEPSSRATSYAPPASQERVATQRSEPSLAMNSSATPGNVTNPVAEPQPQPENKEPEINRNALFPGKRNTQTGGGSQGVTEGTGNQGRPDGSPGSGNFAGAGGHGGSFSLAGRSAVSLPKPVYNSNKQGAVVIDIWVDQQGRVTRVEGPAKGSTLTDGNMVNQAKAAALKARFNADTKAQEVQKGSITYIFKI